MVPDTLCLFAAKVRAILDAATEQFSARGYAGTSMAAIAAKAADLLLFGPFGIKNDSPDLAT